MRRTFAHATATALAAAAVLLLQPTAGSAAAAQPAATHTPVQPVATATAGGASTTTTTTTTTASSTGGTAPTATPGTFRATAWYQVNEAKKKLISLAEATPADKFTWRPAPGVRTLGEVYMHVASANYFFPSLWGGTPPAGVDPRGFEKDGADKAKVLAALNQSFDYLHQAVDGMSEDLLHKQITVFGKNATPSDLVMAAATHAHEHLGQSIAYARSIGVVPPWSVKGD